MQTVGLPSSRYGLENHGIHNVDTVYWNLSTPHLVEEVIRRDEGRVSESGALVVRTGQYTGRSPKDKYVVREPSSRDNIWWGSVNQPMEPEKFDALYARMRAFLEGKKVFVQDCFVGGDPEFQMPIRVISEYAWHSLFARNLFITADADRLADHVPEFTVVYAPSFQSIPEIDGTRSEVFIILNFEKRLLLIGGTQYAGEMKKSFFTVLNYLLPLRGVLSMHSAANIGPDGDVAVFFGLSGTGKTTLSTDPSRSLIGDDEHGWSDRGVFNYEGGCYAKTIHLSPNAEPDIFATTHRFGTVLENVGMDSATGKIDLDDDSLTENTRAAYPLHYIPNVAKPSMGGHPSNIIMLTADAFGVLPPVSRLTPDQAVYHFLSGYTSALAGTERGITEPMATFSTCFGAPFIPLSPLRYGNLLREKLTRHQAACWLVNTGWSGGPYGVGKRMSIAHTRAMVHAILDGRLAEVDFVAEPFFGLSIPTSCPDVPPEVLDPRSSWADKAAYDVQAAKLAAMFRENFAQFSDAPAAVRDAGPRGAA
jgi:phosphoenolpyruvate carboxykinase (ATP)